MPDTDVLCKQAAKRLRQGDLAGATDLFQQVLSADPDHKKALEGLAAAEFQSKNYSAAVEAFEKLTRLVPREARTHINLGAVYNRMGEYAKALAACRKGLARDRKRAEGYYNMGLAHRGLGQAAMAVSAYREALRLNPQMAEAHQNLANALFSVGNFQQAVVHYRKALEIKPDFERARVGLARAEDAIQKAKAAISPFGRLVDFNAARSDEVRFRQLSDDEQVADRRRVFALANGIAGAAAAFLAQFRDEFVPRLVVLDRAVAQGEPGHLVEAYESFCESVARAGSLRAAFKAEVNKLREHEREIGRESAEGPQ